MRYRFCDYKADSLSYIILLLIHELSSIILKKE